MSDLPPNTRRFPRTSQEAFPRTVEYGAPISGPYRKPESGKAGGLLGVAAALACLWVIGSAMA